MALGEHGLALAVLVAHDRIGGSPEGAVHGPAFYPLRIPAPVPEIGVVVDDIAGLQFHDESTGHVGFYTGGSCFSFSTRGGPQMAGGYDVEKAITGQERGVELHKAAVEAAVVILFVGVAGVTKGAVLGRFIGLFAAGGQHAEEAVAQWTDDQIFQVRSEICGQPFGVGRVVFVGVER